MTEQVGQSQRPSVADMVSKYGTPKGTSPVPVKKLLKDVKEDTSKGQSNEPKLKIDQDKTPQPRTDGPTSPIPYKVIQVSPSGEVVDESNPRCSRTMGHYSRSTGHQVKPSKVPPIKPLAFSGPVYGSSKPPTGIPTGRASKSSTSTVQDKVDTVSSSVGTTTPAHTTGNVKDDTTVAMRHSKVIAVQSMGGIHYKAKEESKHSSNNHIFRTKTESSSTSKSSPPSPHTTSAVYEPGGMWFASTAPQTTTSVTPRRGNIKRSQSLADKSKPGTLPSRRRSCRSSLVLDYEADRPSIFALPTKSDTISVAGSNVSPSGIKSVGSTPNLERKSIPVRVTVQKAPIKSYVKVVSQASNSKNESQKQTSDNQASTKSESSGSPKQSWQTSILGAKPVSPVIKRLEKKENTEISNHSQSSSNKMNESKQNRKNSIEGQKTSPHTPPSPQRSARTPPSPQRSARTPPSPQRSAHTPPSPQRSAHTPPSPKRSARTPPSPKHTALTPSSPKRSDDYKSATLPIRRRIEKYNMSNSQTANPIPSSTPPLHQKLAYRSPTSTSQLPGKDGPADDTQRPKSPTSIDCISTPPTARKDRVRPISVHRSQSQDTDLASPSKHSEKPFLTPQVGRRKELAPPVRQKPVRSKSFERKAGPPTLPKPSRHDNVEQNHSLPRCTIPIGSSTKAEDLTPPIQRKADSSVVTASHDQKPCSPRMAKKVVDTSSSDRINEVFKSALDTYSSGMSVKSRIAMFQNNNMAIQKHHRPRMHTKAGPAVASKKPIRAKTAEKAEESVQLLEATSEEGRESVSPQPRMRIASTKDDQPEDNSIDINVYDEGINGLEKVVCEIAEVENETIPCCDNKIEFSLSGISAESGRESTPEIDDNTLPFPKQTGLQMSKSESNVHRRFSDSPIYSYQEYANKRKRNSLPGANVHVEAAKSLEDIPEVTQPSSPFLPSNLPIAEKDTKPERKSSSDSDGGLGKLVPDVSSSFVEEVLSSLTTVIGQSGGLSADEVARVVDGMVSFNPKLSNQAEDIYESVETYGRRISTYFHNMQEQDEEEEPPDLPPRPEFLQKLILEEQEDDISILSDKEYEPRGRSQTIDAAFLDYGDSSLRALSKSPSKMMRFFNRSKSKSPEPQDGRKQVPVKKRHFSFLANKIGPSHLAHVKHITDDERMDSQEYDAESTHKDMSYEHCRPIPYESSGSEPEDNEDDMISRDTISTCSATKLTRGTSVQGSIDDVFPSRTPDSGVYPDVHDMRRYTRDHLTPPLVTKIGTLPSNGMKYSTSDPSLHATIISSFRRKTATITPSSSFTKAEPSNDSSDTNSLTPSISSFESHLDQTPYSPAMRKRVKSDVSHDRNCLVARQKFQYLMRKQKSLRPESSQSEGVIEVPLVHADALMDRHGLEPDELSFCVNDVISILDMTDDDWWQGIVEDRIGWFPSSWVRLRIHQDSDDSASLEHQDILCKPPEKECEKDNESDDLPQPVVSSGRRRTIQKRDSIVIPRHLAPCEVRARCVEELLATEIQYVENLGNIVEGFLDRCRERIGNMFTAEQVEIIFSNIEVIYKFQQEFLRELRARVNRDDYQASQVGKIFVEMGHHFRMYSEYCNNHPHAVKEMNLLQQNQQYAFFFESCRLLRNLQTISLEGFLLTPVQRICRYPLQLTELLKYTHEVHPDYHDLVEAQDVMKQVAVFINEEKRYMENIGHASCWQDTLENWKGEDILVRSTELVHFGELHKISRGHSQERHFFLFDNQMIYCKKELGGKLCYKGRIDTNKCSIVDMKDGEYTHGGSSVKNAWKINNADKDDKLYILFAKSSQSKQEWMDAFSRERELVDRNAGRDIAITPKMKKAAIALYCAGSVPVRRRSFSRKVANAIDVDSTQNSKIAITNSPIEKKRHKKRK